MLVHYNINDLRQTFLGEESSGTYLRPPRKGPSGRPVLPEMPAWLHPREEHLLEDCMSSWHGRLWDCIVLGFSHHMRRKLRADPGYNGLQPGIHPINWRHHQLCPGGHPSIKRRHSSLHRRRPDVCPNRRHASRVSPLQGEKVPYIHGVQCRELVHQHYGD